jgi:Uma2 family endonuclease
MSSAAAKIRLTPQQYLDAERRAVVKSEYYDGQAYAMSGASRRHNLIAINLSREISLQLRDRPCEVYVNDMRVRVSEEGPYTYPDLVVVCGDPRFQDGEFDTLLNPTVLVEILSPSTEAHDRGAKFAYFRRLDSLKEYVLVAQDRVLVERYTRQGDDWLLTESIRLDESLRLTSIDCVVPLSEVYAKVELPTIEASDEV